MTAQEALQRLRALCDYDAAVAADLARITEWLESCSKRLVEQERQLNSLERRYSELLYAFSDFRGAGR